MEKSGRQAGVSIVADRGFTVQDQLNLIDVKHSSIHGRMVTTACSGSVKRKEDSIPTNTCGSSNRMHKEFLDS